MKPMILLHLHQNQPSTFIYTWPSIFEAWNDVIKLLIQAIDLFVIDENNHSLHFLQKISVFILVLVLFLSLPLIYQSLISIWWLAFFVFGMNYIQLYAKYLMQSFCSAFQEYICQVLQFFHEEDCGLKSLQIQLSDNTFLYLTMDFPMKNFKFEPI